MRISRGLTTLHFQAAFGNVVVWALVGKAVMSESVEVICPRCRLERSRWRGGWRVVV